MISLADALDVAGHVVAVCAVVAAVTPNVTDNAVFAVLRKLIDFAAMNWGHAANKKGQGDAA